MERDRTYGAEVVEKWNLEPWQSRAWRDWKATLLQWRHDLAVVVAGAVALLLYRAVSGEALNVDSILPAFGAAFGGLAVYGLVMGIFYAAAAPVRTRDDALAKASERFSRESVASRPVDPVDPYDWPDLVLLVEELISAGEALRGDLRDAGSAQVLALELRCDSWERESAKALRSHAPRRAGAFGSDNLSEFTKVAVPSGVLTAQLLEQWLDAKIHRLRAIIAEN